MRARAMSIACAVLCVATPAEATRPATAGHPVTRLAAQHLGASLRDLTLIATALPLERERSDGSAALVRLDDGRDGGLPSCYLLDLAGRPFAPGKVEAHLRLSVCPSGPVKAAQLARVALSAKHEAWQVRVEAARYDNKAQGAETAVLWGLYGRYGTAEVRALWERTSTTFRSKTDPGMNQAETCAAPQIAAGGQEPASVAVECDTETTLGKLPKRARQTFRSNWVGDRYSMN